MCVYGLLCNKTDNIYHQQNFAFSLNLQQYNFPFVSHLAHSDAAGCCVVHSRQVRVGFYFIFSIYYHLSSRTLALLIKIADE